MDTFIRTGVIDGSILELVLDRSAKLNAINRAMFAEIAAAVARFRDDASLKVMLIRAEGRYFCAGVDLGEAPVGGRDPFDTGSSAAIRAEHRNGLGGMRALLDEIEAVEKPFVIAHQGPCLGGGLELSLSCDFRLASRNARYGFPESAFGALPATGGVSRLARVIGAHWARYMILASRQVDAERALMIGLVHEVFDPESHDEQVLDFCRKLASQSTEAMAMAKIAIELARDVQAGQARTVERLANSALMLGDDYRQTAAAYKRRFRDAGANDG